MAAGLGGERKPPYMAQEAARALHRIGLEVGVIGNALTGRDLHVFDDGEPYVGDVTFVGSGNYAGLHDVMEPPWTRMNGVMRNATPST